MRHFNRRRRRGADPDLLAIARGHAPDVLDSKRGRTRERVGRWAEGVFDRIHTIYKRQNLGVVERIPTTMRFDKKRQRVYRIRSIVDYLGRMGAVPLAFDLKVCEERSRVWRFRQEQKHQRDFLLDFKRDRMGLACFLILDRERECCYIVDPEAAEPGTSIPLRTAAGPCWPVVPRSTALRAPEYDYFPVLRQLAILDDEESPYRA